VSAKTGDIIGLNRSSQNAIIFEKTFGGTELEDGVK